jgi:hypothetical protein
VLREWFRAHDPTIPSFLSLLCLKPVNSVTAGGL